MKAFVDRETCIGCGLCAATCADVFHIDNEGKSVPIETDIPDNNLSDAEAARDNCPVSAISIS